MTAPRATGKPRAVQIRELAAARAAKEAELERVYRSLRYRTWQRGARGLALLHAALMIGWAYLLPREQREEFFGAVRRGRDAARAGRFPPLEEWR